MKERLILLWYFVEVLFAKVMLRFGVKKDSSVIPEGVYCYSFDKEKNAKEPLKGGFWIEQCKYFRSTKNGTGIACTYCGFYGFDFCLYDRCKICGERDGINYTQDNEHEAV